MPIYEFECEKCHNQFVVVETFSEHELHLVHKCPKCGSTEVHQLISSIHVVTSKKS